jgi:hypothetical protein
LGGEGDHLEALGIDGRIIIKVGCQEVGWGNMDWIELAQDGDKQWAHLNAVMNLVL